jgi:hypothetical protein
MQAFANQQNAPLAHEVHSLIEEMSLLFIRLHLLSVLKNAIEWVKHTRVRSVLQEGMFMNTLTGFLLPKKNITP